MIDVLALDGCQGFADYQDDAGGAWALPIVRLCFESGECALEVKDRHGRVTIIAFLLTAFLILLVAGV
jgi:hypothetical protein